MPWELETKDGIVLRGIPDDVAQDDPRLKERVAQARNVSAEPTYDPTGGMSGVEKFRAGIGKAMVDTARGVGQLVGLTSKDDVQQARERDKALMNTGAGMAGDIAGNVGMMLVPGGVVRGVGLAANAPKVIAAGNALLLPKTVPQALAVGGATGAIQPAINAEERAQNITFGAGATAAIPGAGAAARAVKAAVDPFYEGGKNLIVGRVLNRAAGDDAAAAQAAMRAARPLVPGSAPTAAQAANNAGIAALERTAAAIDPGVTTRYASRAAAQNDARVASLEGLIGDRGGQEAAREAASAALYDAAKSSKVKADDALRTLLSRPSMEKAWARAQRLAEENGEKIVSGRNVPARTVPGAIVDAAGNPLTSSATAAQVQMFSGKGLHYLKMGLDDLIGDAQSGIGANEKRAILGTKGALLNWLDTKIPEYGAARREYQRLSRPINQTDVAQAIADKAINPGTGNMTLNSFSRVLNDATAARATGFKPATLEGTFDPQQLARMNAIKEDLQRAFFALNAGRGVGSDTVQKLAYSNVLDASGVPTLVRALPPAQIVGNLMGRAADVLYKGANTELSRRLAEILLDPRAAGEVMGRSAAAQPFLGRTQRALTPLSQAAAALVNSSKE